MNKNEFCVIVQKLIKDIRQENDLSQEVIADKIGVSKKTYIQIEKERINLKWPEAVTICVLFSDSKHLTAMFGDDVLEIIQVVAFQKYQRRQLPTLGGNIWWNTLEEENGFKLQQQKLSKHYRILDKDEFRLYFTLSKSDAKHRFDRYLGK